MPVFCQPRCYLVAAAVFAASPAPAEVRIEDAWVRALPPTQRNTAAYLTLRNEGSEARQVVGGSAAIAGRVEVHRSESVDGMMRMTPVERLVLPPGETVLLAPGATHLMLLDLERMPKEGESVGVCLALDSGEQACTEAPVRRDAGAGDHAHHH